MRSLFRFKFCRTLAVIVLLAGSAHFFSGCQSVVHLRQAQDAFNAAAERDLKYSYNASIVEEDETPYTNQVTSHTEVRNLYAAALAHLDMISQKEEASLKKNRLYGTALTLKALCYWKLKQYEKTLDVKKEAEKIENQLVTRDKQIVYLLSTLVAIDETLAIFQGMSGKEKKEKQEDFERIKNILLIPDDKGDCAVCTINFVLGRDKKTDTAESAKDKQLDKTMEVWALQLKLSALKRYTDAHKSLHLMCPSMEDVYRKEAETTLGELREAAGGASNPAAKKLVDFWVNKIGCSIQVDKGSNQ